MYGGVKHLAGDEAWLEDGDALVEVVLVPGVLLDGVERSAVSAGQAEPLLGTLDRSEETAVPVFPHHTGPSDLLAAHRPEGTVHQSVELHLSPQELLGHHQPVLEVGAPALRAGEERAAHSPAGRADDVGTLAPVQRRLGGRCVADYAHQERGGALGLSDGAVVLPHHPLLLTLAILLSFTSLGVSVRGCSDGARGSDVVVTIIGVLSLTRHRVKDQNRTELVYLTLLEELRGYLEGGPLTKAVLRARGSLLFLLR